MFTTAPKSNTDAIMSIGANAFDVTSVATGAATLTTDQFINGVYIQTGTPGAVTKTTPTAAAIVAAIIGCVVGSTFEFIFDNGGNGIVTIAAGTGVTLSGTATVGIAKNRRFTGVVTNVASPAVRVICGAELA